MPDTIQQIEADPEFRALDPIDKRRLMDRWVNSLPDVQGLDAQSRQVLINRAQSRYQDTPTPQPPSPTPTLNAVPMTPQPRQIGQAMPPMTTEGMFAPQSPMPVAKTTYQGPTMRAVQPGTSGPGEYAPEAILRPTSTHPARQQLDAMVAARRSGETLPPMPNFSPATKKAIFREFDKWDTPQLKAVTPVEPSLLDKALSAINAPFEYAAVPRAWLESKIQEMEPEEKAKFDKMSFGEKVQYLRGQPIGFVGRPRSAYGAQLRQDAAPFVARLGLKGVTTIADMATNPAVLASGSVMGAAQKVRALRPLAQGAQAAISGSMAAGGVKQALEGAQQGDLAEAIIGGVQGALGGLGIAHGVKGVAENRAQGKALESAATRAVRQRIAQERANAAVQSQQVESPGAQDVRVGETGQTPTGRGVGEGQGDQGQVPVPAGTGETQAPAQEGQVTPEFRNNPEEYARANLKGLKKGAPGITEDTIDGQPALISRDIDGKPQGILKYDGSVLTDIAVNAKRRQLGIADELVTAAKDRGVQSVRGPFTPESVNLFAKHGLPEETHIPETAPVLPEEEAAAIERAKNHPFFTEPPPTVEPKPPVVAPEKPSSEPNIVQITTKPVQSSTGTRYPYNLPEGTHRFRVEADPLKKGGKVLVPLDEQGQPKQITTAQGGTIDKIGVSDAMIARDFKPVEPVKAQEPTPAAPPAPTKTPTGEAQAAPKEPWMMTRKEYVAANKSPNIHQKAMAELTHRAYVKKAVVDGKPVPPEVLKDYPDYVKPSPGAVPVQTGALEVSPAPGARVVEQKTAAQVEKVKRTGFTQSQEDFLAGELSDVWNKQSGDITKSEPTTIKVPGDGTFKINGPVAAATLHKALTGTAIPGSEFRPEVQMTKKYTGAGDRQTFKASEGPDAKWLITKFGGLDKAIAGLEKQIATVDPDGTAKETAGARSMLSALKDQQYQESPTGRYFKQAGKYASGEAGGARQDYVRRYARFLNDGGDEPVQPKQVGPKVGEKIRADVQRMHDDYFPNRLNIPAIHDLYDKMEITGEHGEKRAAAGMDPRILGVLGGNLYSGDLGKIAVKEMLQNAVDSVRHLGKTGQITVDYDPYTKSIHVADNGHGMSPAVAMKELVDIGGSLKGEGSSGGFGIAKVAIFANAESIHVVTTADVGGQRIMTTIKGSGADWLDPKKGMEVTSTPVLNDHPTGTKMNITLKPEIQTSRYMVKPWVQEFITHHNLETKVKAVVSGEELQPGQQRGQFDQIHEEKIPGATLKFSVSKDTTESGSIPVQILNRGLPQFSENHYLSRPMKVPSQMVIDIQPDSGPEHGDYPFRPDREGLRSDASSAVQRFVDSKLVNAAAQAESEQLKRVFEEAPHIPTIRNNADGGRIHVVDTHDLLPKALAESIAKAPYIQRMSVLAMESFNKFMGVVSDRYPGASATRFGGIGLGGDYLGINIRMGKLLGGGESDSVLLNPYAILKEIEADPTTTVDNLHDKLAEQIAATLLHEGAHAVAHGHNTDFAGVLTRLSGDSYKEFYQAVRSMSAAIKDMMDHHEFREWEKHYGEITAHWSAIDSSKNVAGRASDYSEADTGPVRSSRDITGNEERGNKSARRVQASGADTQEGVPTMGRGPGVRKPIADRLKATEDAARARIKENLGRAQSGIPVDLMKDLVIAGAAKITRHGIEFAQWSAEMVKEFGEKIKPHLQEIYDAAKTHLAARIAEQGHEPLGMTPEHAVDTLAGAFDKEIANETGIPASGTSETASSPRTTEQPGEPIPAGNVAGGEGKPRDVLPGVQTGRESGTDEGVQPEVQQNGGGAALSREAPIPEERQWLEDGGRIVAETHKDFDSWSRRMKENVGDIPDSVLKGVYDEIAPKAATGGAEPKPAVPPVEPPKEPPVATGPGEPKPPKKEMLTAPRNEVTEAERAERGIQPKVAKQPYRYIAQMHKEGRALVDKAERGEDGGIDPRALAQEVSNNPRGLSGEETNALAYDRARLKVDHAAIEKRIATADPANAEVLKLRRSGIEALQLRNDEALQKSGLEWHLTGMARQTEIATDFSVSRMITRAYKANAEKARRSTPDPKLDAPTEEQRARIDALATKIKGHEDRIAELEKQNAEQAEQIIDLQTKRIEKSSQRNDIQDRLSKERKRLERTIGSKLAKFGAAPDPTVVPDLIRLARNYVQSGVSSLDGVVDSVWESTKEHAERLGWTKPELKTALANGIRDPKFSRVIDPKIALEKAKLRDARQNANTILDRWAESKTQYRIRIGTEIVNVPRAIMESGNLHATMRQALWLSVANPKAGAKSLGASFKALFSDQAAQTADAIARHGANEGLYEGMGLHLADKGLAQREEAFMSSVAEKIPGLGRLVRASGRAYSVGLNVLRTGVADQGIDTLHTAGMTPENSPQAYRDLARFINIASGWGSLGKAEGAAPQLNTIFYSPRFAMSRLQLMYGIATGFKGYDPVVRKMAIKSIAANAAFGLSVMGLAKMAGATVSTDPDSSDFGKILYGNTHIDVSAGIGPYLRAITKIASKSYKQYYLGENPKWGQATAADVAQNFITSKFSPPVSLGWDIIRGKDIAGRPVAAPSEIGTQFSDWMNKIKNGDIGGAGKQPLESTLGERMSPIALREVWENMQEYGPVGGGLLSVPAFFGVSQLTYEPHSNGTATKKRDPHAGMGLHIQTSKQIEQSIRRGATR